MLMKKQAENEEGGHRRGKDDKGLWRSHLPSLFLITDRFLKGYGDSENIEGWMFLVGCFKETRKRIAGVSEPFSFREHSVC